MLRYLILLLLTCITTTIFSQNNPRPSKSRFWLNKHATFQLNPGDVLVYQVNNQEQYELLITIKQHTGGLTFDYSIPEKNKQGTVNLSAAEMRTGINYENIFNSVGNNFQSKNKGVLWLSQNNYRQLASRNSKLTKMDMGNGLETFTRNGGSTQKINYKGKEKIVTVYKIANDGTTGKKEFSVLTDIENPLIVNWSGGGVMTLKEVR